MIVRIFRNCIIELYQILEVNEWELKRSSCGMEPVVSRYLVILIGQFLFGLKTVLSSLGIKTRERKHEDGIRMDGMKLSKRCLIARVLNHWNGQTASQHNKQEIVSNLQMLATDSKN
uniref:Uncharacterized protein n=1 Tax=Utricularia reniformis TaxID=192314 RepID=A0A1Y0AZX5_9LAMI|nr:hypothetical protein AEK19_MT0479 [Utricularia reniformis]ART30736.1 hypothetical protein AEK19_MT0479 [Utricularia reniformis]